MFECFIAGTGTDVGKTIVAAGIASLCVDAGLATTVLKPVQTGTRSYAPDTDTVAALVPELASPPHGVETLRSFSYPASPHLAAEMEKREIGVEDLLSGIEASRPKDLGDALIVEGAGGVMVPLNRDILYLEVIARLNIPVVVVGDAGLGTINHTLRTVSALKNAGAKVAGVILNRSLGDVDPVEKDNRRVVADFADVPLLAVIRNLRGKDGAVSAESLRAEFALQDALAEFVRRGTR